MSGSRLTSVRICLALLGALLALRLAGLTTPPISLAAFPEMGPDTPIPQQWPAGATVLAAITNVTLTASADARICEGVPTQIYGSDPQLVVAYSAVGKGDLSLIHFEIGSVPPGITITEAALRVSATDRAGTTNPIPVSVRRVTSFWDEETSWSNKPSVSPIVTTTPTSGHEWVTWDVTALVREWYGGHTNYGLQLGGPASGQYGLYISSREGLHAPELVVSYDTEPTSTPTATPPRPTPSSTATTTTPPYYDLGDAPDSSNSRGITMTAYSGVGAYFPTVFEAGSPPYGPRHWNHPSQFFLGNQISLEFEADYGQDQDQGVHNIDPYINSANQDKGDDGLALPVTFNHCQLTTLQFTVTVLAGAPRQAYVNLWLDWNRNVRWGENHECQGATAPEWAVKDQVIDLPGPGTFVTHTEAFLPFNLDTDKAMWLRITLSEVAAPPASANGGGLRSGYEAGETEDYLLRGAPAPTSTPTPTERSSLTPPPTRTQTPTMAARRLYLPIVLKS